jgi:hypothetical protein
MLGKKDIRFKRLSKIWGRGESRSLEDKNEAGEVSPRIYLGRPWAGTFHLWKTLLFNIANVCDADAREQSFEQTGFLGVATNKPIM